ncbi:MAG: calcium-binding protein, partial [Cyclobacteriaceae bacterium]
QNSILNIKYSFDIANSSWTSSDFTGKSVLTNQILFESALNNWARFLNNVNFVEDDTNPNITFFKTDFSSESVLGQANTSVSGQNEILGSEIAIDSDQDASTAQAYHNALHEIGHAIGLKGDSALGSDYNTDMTVMSYNVPSGRYAATPMVMDILAVEEMYGSASLNSGDNDTYSYVPSGTGVEEFNGSLRSITIMDTGGIGDTFDFSAYTGGGVEVDLRTAIDSNGDWTGDLANGVEGYHSEVGSEYIYIAHNTIIENAIGTFAADTIIGNSADNQITGGQGNDILQGGTGDDEYMFNIGDGSDEITDTSGTLDKITFGSGFDLADFSFAQIGNDLEITISGSTDEILIKDHYTTGTIERIEFNDGLSILPSLGSYNVIDGNNLNNTLTGTSGNDIINGFGGDDTIYGEGGDDIIYSGDGAGAINGGAGNDVIYALDKSHTFVASSGFDQIYGSSGIDYFTVEHFSAETVTQGLNLNLETGIVTNNGFGDSGLMYDVENVVATSFSDTIVAYNPLSSSQLGSRIFAREGDDNLTGGLGKDIFFGEEGNDILYGMGGNDTLAGGDGEDLIYGGDHNDIITGGLDDDILLGGSGNDYYSFTSGDGYDTITDTSGSLDELYFRNVSSQNHATSSQAFLQYVGNDLIINFSGVDGGGTVKVIDHNIGSSLERIVFQDSSQITLFSGNSMTGDNADNTIAGAAGDDTISGLDGNDTLYGNNGNDTLIGGIGNDTLDGGDGIDTVDYSSNTQGVNIQLLNGVYDEDGDGINDDTLISIENIIGSAYNDYLQGHNAFSSTIYGGAGNDTILGQDGDDILYGGSGDDH